MSHLSQDFFCTILFSSVSVIIVCDKCKYLLFGYDFTDNLTKGLFKLEKTYLIFFGNWNIIRTTSKRPAAVGLHRMDCGLWLA